MIAERSATAQGTPGKRRRSYSSSAFSRPDNILLIESLFRERKSNLIVGIECSRIVADGVI